MVLDRWTYHQLQQVDGEDQRHNPHINLAEDSLGLCRVGIEGRRISRKQLQRLGLGFATIVDGIGVGDHFTLWRIPVSTGTGSSDDCLGLRTLP